jgi:Short C-terminal domain
MFKKLLRRGGRPAASTIPPQQPLPATREVDLSGSKNDFLALSLTLRRRAIVYVHIPIESAANYRSGLDFIELHLKEAQEHLLHCPRGSIRLAAEGRIGEIFEIPSWLTYTPTHALIFDGCAIETQSDSWQWSKEPFPTAVPDALLTSERYVGTLTLTSPDSRLPVDTVHSIVDYFDSFNSTSVADITARVYPGWFVHHSAPQSRKFAILSWEETTKVMAVEALAKRGDIVPGHIQDNIDLLEPLIAAAFCRRMDDLEKLADSFSEAVQVRQKEVAETARIQNQAREQRDVYSELLKLDDLRKRGILTDAEFAAEKSRLLNR